MPEPLGIDGDVETVSFIPGDAGSDCWEHQHTEQGLRSAAELLRGVHDASRGWRPPDDAQWGIPAMANPEVICHGDPGPWNMVWDGPKAIGLVDWDLAHPASVVDDVAYALEYFAPFRDDLYAAERHHFRSHPTGDDESRPSLRHMDSSPRAALSMRSSPDNRPTSTTSEFSQTEAFNRNASGSKRASSKRWKSGCDGPGLIASSSSSRACAMSPSTVGPP